MSSDYKKMIVEIDRLLKELKKKKIFSPEIAELCMLRELLVEQVPYENINNSAR
jgi:hypothetical protein